MPVVIKRFKERYQDMKLYKEGDSYDFEDEERIEYLASQGFLSMNEPEKPSGEAGSDKENENNPEGGGGGDPSQGHEQELAAESKTKRGGKTKPETPDAG